jgi:hypothetical protein
MKTALKTQRVAVWAGPVGTLIFAVGFWVFARFVPPPSPAHSAQQIADIFRHNTHSILVGLILTCGASTLLVPFFVAISLQMRRIEGQWGPLAATQMLLGALAVLVFIFPCMILEAIAFRPSLPLGTIQALHDVAWIQFVGCVWTVMLQHVVIGVAILQDHRETPIFPRWAGYFTLAVLAPLVPPQFVVFVKSGPLAWNGLLTWWVSLASFFVWMAAMTVLLLKAIDRQEAETISASTTSPGDAQVELQVELLRDEVADLRGKLGRITETRSSG